MTFDVIMGHEPALDEARTMQGIDAVMETLGGAQISGIILSWTKEDHSC